MPIRIKTFDVELRQELSVARLETLSDEAAEAADEDGYLGGNQHYQDLRSFSWEELAQVLTRESALIERIGGAADPAVAEEKWDQERDLDGEPIDGLWGLDLGVAAAVVALSALGAVPFISCNGGTFGMSHLGSHPYVAFYLGGASRQALGDLAMDAGVGLSVHEGIPRLCARSVLDLQRFAQLALKQYGAA